jgi:hypothetical protein
MSIVWVWILIGAFIADGIIRVMMFLNDKRMTYYRLNSLWQEKTSMSLKELYKTFIKATDINLHRFGIRGEFPVQDVEVNREYGSVGDKVNIAIGIIKNKSFITTEEILNSMQKFVQNTGESFDSVSDAIEDKYIVEMFLKHDLMRQFMWDEKELFNNVEIGDEVTLTFDERECYHVGFLKKGDKDVGTNANISA